MSSDISSRSIELRRLVMRRLAELRLPAQGPPQEKLRAAWILLVWLALLAGWIVAGMHSTALAVGAGGALGLWSGITAMALWHDATHFAAFEGRRWNRLLGVYINLLGGSYLPWLKKHVALHHGFTNIVGQDDDLGSGLLLRLHRLQKWQPWHRFQHLYAVPLYALLALKWMLVDDFLNLGTDTFGLTPRVRRRAWVEAVLARLVHAGIFWAVPLLLWGSVGRIVVAYLAIMLVMGLSVALTFQLAHVTGDIAAPDGPNRDRVAHQLATTANFATRNRLLTELTGALNHQIEHHLFPDICSANLPKIQPIVREYAIAQGLTYIEYPSLAAVIRAHFSHMRNLGRGPELDLLARKTAAGTR